MKDAISSVSMIYFLAFERTPEIFYFLSEKSTWRIPSSHLGEIKLAGRGDPNFALREGGGGG